MMLSPASGNVAGGSNALEVQIPCIVFFVLTPIFVAIRVHSRTRLRGGLDYDDFAILASFVSCSLFNIESLLEREKAKRCIRYAPSLSPD